VGLTSHFTVLSALSECYKDEEKIRTIVTRLLGKLLCGCNNAEDSRLPESLGSEKSIWEHYNEMAAVDDNIREVEWRDLADTVLIFVCMGSTWYIAVDVIPGWTICRLPFRLPCLPDSPAPAQQH
jgi:hypothetical protein